MERNSVEALTNSSRETRWTANDNRRRALAFGRSVFEADSVARIYKPSRSAMTSARSRAWRLEIERRRPQFVEPLMGWTGDEDPLAQVHLTFPTKEAAVAYAERQGLAYAIDEMPPKTETGGHRKDDGQPSFSDATLRKLGLGALEDSYGAAMAAPTFADADVQNSAMSIVTDSGPSLEEKPSLLMNPAWNEYLADQAISQGMPENGRKSRLHEIELAPLAFEREARAQRASVSLEQKAA